jgi:hypothetical protein
MEEEKRGKGTLSWAAANKEVCVVEEGKLQNVHLWYLLTMLGRSR